MTRKHLSAWARLIRIATREGWPPARLDAEMAKVGP